MEHNAPRGPQVTDLSPMERMTLIRRGEALLAGRKGDPQLHLQLGMLYRAEGQLDHAIHHLNIANKAMKKNPVVTGQLAEAYVKMKDYHSAKKYVRKMVELEPRNEKVLIYQAEFLEKAGMVRQALEAWQKLTRLFPDNPTNLRDLAACHQSLGEWQEADRVFKRVLELDPLHSQALYRYANLRKYEPEEARELLKSVRASIEREREPIDKANLYFSAGKLCLEAGDIDAAMADFAAGNAIHKPKTTNSSEKRAFANTKAVFTKDFIKKHSVHGSQSDAPIFILGMPRSGTTLVESLIGGHSLVTAGDEMNFIAPISDRMGIRRSDETSIKRMLETLASDQIGELAQEYLEATKELQAKTPHFTDKLPHNFMQIGLINTLFPKSHIIHCRRHPVDNCLSLYSNSMLEFHNAYKTDLTTLGLYYQQYLNLMEHWRQSVPGGFHEVFYEDVVANTELNARAMIDYLGLEWEDSVMARENSQKSVRTLSMWQVRQPIYTSSAGRWKKFEKHLGPLIDALGSSVSAYENALNELNKGSTK